MDVQSWTAECPPTQSTNHRRFVTFGERRRVSAEYYVFDGRKKSLSGCRHATPGRAATILRDSWLTCGVRLNSDHRLGGVEDGRHARQARGQCRSSGPVARRPSRQRISLRRRPTGPRTVSGTSGRGRRSLAGLSSGGENCHKTHESNKLLSRRERHRAA